MSRARDFADLAGSADAGGLTGRNLIINGAMQVAQRGTSSTSTGYQTVDRFSVTSGNTDELAFTQSQSTTVPSGQGFSNSLKIEVTTAETTLASNEFFRFQHKVEAQNLQQLAYGTSSAKSITLSFWVRSSLTGKYSILVFQEDATRSNTPSFTISAADTWEKKTITLDGDTGGTINNDNGTGLLLNFILAAGTDYAGTPHTGWGAYTTTDDFAHDDQVNFIAQTGTFYITGIQLEVGETATPFEHRSYGDELARCQRYYYFHGQGTGSNTGDIGIGSYYSSSSLDVVVQFPVTMRATPTVDATSGTNYYVSFRNSGADYFNSFTLSKGSPSAAAIGNSSEASGTGGQATVVRYENASARVAFDSEL